MLRPRRRRFAVAAGMVALALVAAGCGEAPSEGSGWVGTAGSTPSPSTSAETADLLSFSAPTVGGGEVDAASFRGRPTLLWFWAPW